MAKKHSLPELYQYQALPLSVKIAMTRDRVKGWIDEYGEDGVYISFSGGKDSTVLLDLVRNKFGYKNVPAVFFDVPTQFPELREFAMKFENVEIIKPKYSFMEVCEKYGFPFLSKEISECVQGARKYLTSIMNDETVLQTDRQTDRQGNYYYFYDKLCGTGKYAKSEWGGTITSSVNYEALANILNDRMKNRSGGSNQRLAIMLGMLTKNQEIRIQENIPEFDRSKYSMEKYKFMLDAPFEISNKCCDIMKKNPAKEYSKKTGRNAITAQMASESRLRTQKWLQDGCNGFHLKRPISNPMSFWLEQDVLTYIYENNLEICSVYGDVVPDTAATGQIEGQMSLSDFGVFDKERPVLKCTGCDRTGCMLCGFGAHIEKRKETEGRFERLKRTHPGMYNLLDVVSNNGYTFRQAIDWYNEHVNDDRRQIPY